MANYFKSNIPQQAQAFVTQQQSPDQLVQNMTDRLNTGVSNLNRGTTFQQMQASEAQSQGYNIQDLIAYQQAKKDAEVLETAQRLSEGNQAAAEQYIEQVNRAREAQAQQKQSEYDTWQNAQAMSNIEPKKEEGGIKWWHIALGAGVVGGVAWYLLKDDKPSTPQLARYNPFLEYDDEYEEEEEEEEEELMDHTIAKINASIAEATKNIGTATNEDEIDEILELTSKFLDKCKKSIYNIDWQNQAKVKKFIEKNLEALENISKSKKTELKGSASPNSTANIVSNIMQEIGKITNHSGNFSNIKQKIDSLANESKRNDLNQLLTTTLSDLKIKADQKQSQGQQSSQTSSGSTTGSASSTPLKPTKKQQEKTLLGKDADQQLTNLQNQYQSIIDANLSGADRVKAISILHTKVLELDEKVAQAGLTSQKRSRAIRQLLTDTQPGD